MTVIKTLSLKSVDPWVLFFSVRQRECRSAQVIPESRDSATLAGSMGSVSGFIASRLIIDYKLLQNS